MNRYVRVCGWLVLAAGGALASAAPAGAQQGGLTIRANAMEIQLGGRIHTQFNTTSVEEEPETEMFMRRARLEATVRVNRVVSGRIQPEFAGSRVTLKDAYVKLDFTPALQLLAGQAYRPFSLLEQTSSNRILPIERGLAIRGVEGNDQYDLVHDLGYSDRDVGFQVMGAPAGAPLGLSYAAGVFAGPLAGRTGNEATHQFAARATVRPIPVLALGAAWSNRAFARDLADDEFEIERGSAIEIDAELGAFGPGPHLLAEAVFGDHDPFTGAEFTAAQAWLGYQTPALGESVSAVEPLVRLSHSSFDGAAEELGGTLVTPGVNVYFGGLNRFMLNYDVWFPRGGGRTHRSLRAQFQVAF